MDIELSVEEMTAARDFAAEHGVDPYTSEYLVRAAIDNFYPGGLSAFIADLPRLVDCVRHRFAGDSHCPLGTH